MSEPRVWQIPDEPPVGTVVSAEDDSGPVRFRRVEPALWFQIDESGAPMGRGMTWTDVLECGPVVEVVPDAGEQLVAAVRMVAELLETNPVLRVPYLSIASHLIIPGAHEPMDRLKAVATERGIPVQDQIGGSKKDLRVVTVTFPGGFRFDLQTSVEPAAELEAVS